MSGRPSILVLCHTEKQAAFVRDQPDVDWSNGWSLIQNEEAITHADLLVIWNGQQPEQRSVVAWAERQCVPTIFFEQGIIDQKANYSWAVEGFNAASELNRAVLATSEQRANLATVREQLQQQYPLEPNGTVLVPLQLHRDTQVRYSTPYRTMDEFVECLAVAYPSQPVVLRTHPRYSGAMHRRSWPSNFRFETDGSFLQAAAKASVVVGLTSTCLWDAAVLGVPVVAWGDHPLRRQPRRFHDDVTAIHLWRNLPRSTPIGTVLDRLGLRYERGTA